MTQRLPIRPLHTESDYAAAMAEYEGYFDNEPTPDTPEGDRFKLLGSALADYEQANRSA